MRVPAFILSCAAVVFVSAIIHWSLVDVGPVRLSDSFYVYSGLGGILWFNVNIWFAFPITQPKNLNVKETNW